MQYVKLTTSGLLLASFLLLFSGCGSAVPDALAPDLVLHNGKIVTVDEDFSIAEAQGQAQAYLAGINTFPDGRTEPLTLRLTSVWVKQDDGQWKEAHDHLSELRGAIPGE